MKMASLGKLDYVILLCNDLANTRKFYEQVLKLKLQKDLEGWIEFATGDTLLTLRERKRLYDGQSDSKTPSVQLAFKVDTLTEVDEWCVILKEQKISIIEPPKDQKWGHRTVFFSDPEGNIVEIYCDI